MGKIAYIPDDRHGSPGTQLVTLDDLEKFRVKLMMDIKMMLEGQHSLGLMKIEGKKVPRGGIYNLR